MLLLVDNVHEKTSQTVLTDINFGSAHALIGNLHSCYDFPLVLHENVLVFNHSGVRNFFMYIFSTAIVINHEIHNSLNSQAFFSLQKQKTNKN